MHPTITPQWMIKQGFSKTLMERFNKRVSKTESCWNWTGKTHKFGYGMLYARGVDTQVTAHRISWMSCFGPIPDGKCVLHKCDNPCCVNPSHLWIGTKKDNTQDMYSKGRQHNPGRKDALSYKRKLSVENIKVVLEMYPTTSQGALGKLFNVNQSTISRIVNHRRRFMQLLTLD